MMDFFIDLPLYYFMIAPAIVGGIIAAGGALASSGASVASNKLSYKDNVKLAAQQNQYNEALQRQAYQNSSAQAQEAYAQNLMQWQRENEYNSPEAQLQRYTAAGLNPNLIYGTGAASAGNASGSPQKVPVRYEAATAQRANRQPFYNGQFDPYQAVSIGNQLSIQKAQRDSLNAQADYTKQQTKNAAVDNLIKTVQRSGLEFDLDFKRETRHLAKEQLYQTIQKLQSDTALGWSRYELNKINTDLAHQTRDMNLTQKELLKTNLQRAQQARDVEAFKAQLLKIGITDRDPFWSRIISRLFLSEGDLDKLLNF